ncbi:adhesion G protein-coupled receptor E3-like [Amia ocellicauda]|uniref:adhesion G protein-coupled receptor E3-like n=1 Tax=Amia ocellicauda TaxID=2972642 RepID=UPI0034645E4C
MLGFLISVIFVICSLTACGTYADDECKIPDICPHISYCFNTKDGYYCQCPEGFTPSQNGTIKFTDGSIKCIDVDECKSSTPLCGSNASCRNAPGSYSCECDRGFSGRNCKDINECNMIPLVCGSNASCKNEIGGYRCECHDGFINSGNSTGHCSDETKGNPDIANFTTHLNEIKQQSLSDIKNNQTQKAADALSNFLNVIAASNKSAGQKSELGGLYLHAVEDVLLALPGSSEKLVKRNQSADNLDLQWLQIPPNYTVEHNIESLQTSGNTLDINLTSIVKDNTQGGTTVGFASYTGLESVLSAKFLQNSQNNASPRMNSQIVTVVIGQKKNQNLSQPINITFQHNQIKGERETVQCVYWKHEGNYSSWSTEGCKEVHSNPTHTVCSLTHLSSFALIMATDESQIKDDSTLQMITYIFLSIALVCLCLAILTFVLCVSVHKGNTALHLHLSLCLFMANLLFLVGVGVSKTENKLI